MARPCEYKNDIGMKISISLPSEMVKEIDRKRGKVPRSTFIQRRLNKL